MEILVQQQDILREGTITNIWGLSFDGNIPQWRITYLTIYDGEPNPLDFDPFELSVENRPIGKDKIRFLIDELGPFETLIETGQIKARPYGRITADGVTFQVQQWSKQYADWGMFTYYRGRPVNQTDTSH